MGWKTLSLAFGLLVLLAGCSGSSSSDSSETTKKTPEATASSSAAETSGTEDSGEPLEGGRFVRLFVDPPTPHV